MAESDRSAERVDVRRVGTGLGQPGRRSRRRTPRSPRRHRCRRRATPPARAPSRRGRDRPGQHRHRVDAGQREGMKAGDRASARAARRHRTVVISSAAAPSEIWDELAAGDHAVGAKRGLERRPAFRACHRAGHPRRRRRVASDRHDLARRMRPASIAAAARWRATGARSRPAPSRPSFQRSAISSAPIPWRHQLAVVPAQHPRSESARPAPGWPSPASVSGSSTPRRPRPRRRTDRR